MTNSQLDTTNESQEVSPFPASDHKAQINRRAHRHNKHRRQKKNIKRRSPSILYLFTGQRARLKNFRIKSLLPSTDYYMTYEGSLTQPGCQESVTWILLNKPIYVNNDQVRLITCRRHFVAFLLTHTKWGRTQRPMPKFRTLCLYELSCCHSSVCCYIQT